MHHPSSLNAFKHIGIIGLGNMGLSMAINLNQKGSKVLGFDVSPVAVNNAMSAGISVCQSLKELIIASDVIILSLPKAEQVVQICLGDESILAHQKSGLIVIDTTTSTPKASRQVHAQFAKHGMTFMDAPVSGGPKGAVTGMMSMVVGADDESYQQVLPLLQAMSAKQVCVGAVGAGNVVKIANNLLIASHLITTAEMVSLAHQAGVSPEKFLMGLNQGSGRSAASEVNFPTWILNKAYDSGFTMGLMRKDVGLAAELAGELGLDLPMMSWAVKLWQDSKDALSDEQDFNEIVKLTDEIFR